MLPYTIIISALQSVSLVAAPVIKDPERMYKIVLAGDAAVGKSSFIMRLCKGKFMSNLSSTLGELLNRKSNVIELSRINLSNVLIPRQKIAIQIYIKKTRKHS